ncbi:peptide/nickel transport system permease protein [Pararhizobium capsulatum DSM 1112]|uniref:Peptide/nickel transport system permease protein n=1 Tax=Pararhizobium capsulatum DSM 1112 TaxID=1121113 RepID=A0ABU0BYM3_9HYPH|nr:ABC transporter permease [Pararhizobium capsulatum]MDQ0323371.1 peptide/nickel transport system permease protein [Pararhizobium capsulatum DSM 1112]
MALVDTIEPGLRPRFQDHRIARLIARRFLIGLVLLFVISTLIFIGTEILPGDAATALLGRSATPAALAELRVRLGLDRPLVERYLVWLANVLQGDFGVSLMNGRSVTSSLGLRLGNTLFLAAAAALVSVPLSVFLGILSVRYRGTVLDRSISALTRGIVALPEFFVGYLLIFVFSITLGWLASSATVFETMGLGDRVLAMILPCLTLTLAVTGHITTMTRAALLNTLALPYIEMAILKGASRSFIIWHHAFPNALAAITNVVILNLAYLVAGVVVVEVIFVYPGMGQFMVDSVVNRDIPVVQACCLLFAGVYIGLNLLADVVSILANPRLRYPK